MSLIIFLLQIFKTGIKLNLPTGSSNWNKVAGGNHKVGSAHQSHNKYKYKTV